MQKIQFLATVFPNFCLIYLRNLYIVSIILFLFCAFTGIVLLELRKLRGFDFVVSICVGFVKIFIDFLCFLREFILYVLVLNIYIYIYIYVNLFWFLIILLNTS